MQIKKPAILLLYLAMSSALFSSTGGPTPEETARKSDLIILGSVESVEQNELQQLDEVTIRVLYVFKNRRNLSKIKPDSLIRLNGPYSGSKFTLSSISHFPEGDTARVFMLRTKEKNYGVDESGSNTIYSTELIPRILKSIK